MRTMAAFLLAVFPLSVFGSPDDNGRGARPISLANAFVAVADDPWSTYYNPAGLARLKSIHIAGFIVPEQFGLRELRTAGATGAFPLSFATASVMMNQFGFDLYRETSMSLGIGRGLGDGFSLGMTINVDRLSIERYGRTSTFAVDIGAQADITEELRLGFCWKNVTAAGIGATAEPLPQIQMLGLNYEFTANSHLMIEWEKDIRYPFSFEAGCEQRFFGFASLRFGVSTNPDKFSFGIGVSRSFVEFSYAVYSHAQLGWTHQIELSFKLE
jgi:hypothetical protein